MSYSPMPHIEIVPARISTISPNVVACALFSLLAAGCGTAPRVDYSKVDLVDVSGTVMLDGMPLPNAVVTFESENGRFSYGLTDADGYYTMRFDSRMNGVTPGKKIIRISTTRRIAGLNTIQGGEAPRGEIEGEEGMERPPAQLELVPEKYDTESELTRMVKPDEDQTFDFKLESGI